MKYFAYGANMDPENMKERGVFFSKREYAILEGWKLKFNKMACDNPAEGYANIEKDEKSIVEGILYEIPGSDIEKLDEYEEYPEHYRRMKIKVRLKDGRRVEAVAYIANPSKIKEGLKPSREYLEHLLRGCDLLSKEYCEKLKRLETID